MFGFASAWENISECSVFENFMKYSKYKDLRTALYIFEGADLADGARFCISGFVDEQKIISRKPQVLQNN